MQLVKIDQSVVPDDTVTRVQAKFRAMMEAELRRQKEGVEQGIRLFCEAVISNDKTPEYECPGNVNRRHVRKWAAVLNARGEEPRGSGERWDTPAEMARGLLRRAGELVNGIGMWAEEDEQMNVGDTYADKQLGREWEALGRLVNCFTDKNGAVHISIKGYDPARYALLRPVVDYIAVEVRHAREVLNHDSIDRAADE